jgi:hypothetical protein
VISVSGVLCVILGFSCVYVCVRARARVILGFSCVYVCVCVSLSLSACVFVCMHSCVGVGTRVCVCVYMNSQGVLL